MLKDLNRFFSKDRLCIRNLPVEITNEKLRSLIFKFVQPKPKISELRVMKDMKTGKNKGFAFLSLASHDMAVQVTIHFFQYFNGFSKFLCSNFNGF